MESDSLRHWLRLTLISGVGGETQRKLLTAFGSPEAVFAQSPASWSRVISERYVRHLNEAAHDAKIETAISQALTWAEHAEQHIVTLADAEYPQALLQTADPPSLLYVRGRLELLNRPSISIVGSRHPTPQGEQNAERFAAALSDAGLVVSSGLALGIDAAAHRGALRGSAATIAFIGTGIDRVYPARNRDLALEIGRQGAIVSEFPLGTPVMAANFPRRNRLISGVALGVLVVEAALESGSLITARLASEQGREVFAIPGSIHSPQARGCHHLIRQGAKLVETAQDILEELQLNQTPSLIAPAPHTVLRQTASDDKSSDKSSDNSGDKRADGGADNGGGNRNEQSALLDALGFDPCSLDELALRMDLPASALPAQLCLNWQD